MLGVQVAGQSGAIRPGPFHPDQRDLAKAAQPPQQLPIAAGVGWEAAATQERTDLVQGGSHVNVQVGVDAAGDAVGHALHCRPFRLEVGMAPHQPGGRTGQRRASATGS
jgi:hypothetical protein